MTWTTLRANPFMNWWNCTPPRRRAAARDGCWPTGRPSRSALCVLRQSLRHSRLEWHGADTLTVVRSASASAELFAPMTSSAHINTINDLFFRVADAANSRSILWQDHAGEWQPLSSGQIYQRVRAVGSRLLEWDVKKGDRVALISENRWEWAVTDFAILAIGAADVPVYPTLTGEQIAVLLADADCRIAFVSTRAQFDKLNAVRSQTPLERIVMMDANVAEGAVSYSSLIEGADSLGEQRDSVFDSLAHSAGPG